MAKEATHPQDKRESFERTLLKFHCALVPKLMKGEIRISEARKQVKHDG
jgi:hypothetical protein